MAKKTFIFKNFSGGIGTIGEKIDVQNSCKFSKNLNPFEDPSYVTLSPKTTKKSGTTVEDLPKWMVDGSPWTTDRYVYDEGGIIYSVDSSDSFTKERTVSSSNGQGLVVFDDFLYYATTESLGRYGKLSDSPSFSDTFLEDGTTNIDQQGGGTGSEYSTETSISETATKRLDFTPSQDPLVSVTIDVDTVGSGDWTLTLHDSRNVSVGSKTIANGDMSTGDMEFTFSSPLRVEIGNEYHVHATTTVADGKVETDTASDMRDAEYSTKFGILVSDTDFHPMIEHLNQLIIGNERYLGAWDQAVYDPNAVVLPPGFRVRSLAKFNEFVAAGCWRGDSIDKAEEARIYFWDGISSTFNFYVDCTVGAPNALTNLKNNLIGVCGQEGSVYMGFDPFSPVVDKLPKLARGKYVEVYPGAVTTFQGDALVGYTGTTDDGSGVEAGVYQLGKQKTEALPERFNYLHTISTGTTQGTTLKIGMVKAFGKELYIGWDDDGTYGVDKVEFGDDASTSGSWESLIFDAGDPDKEFLPLKIEMQFEELASDESVTPKYKLDRASSFTTGTAADTEDDTNVELVIYQRCNEIEFGFDLASSSGTYPKVTAVKMTYDDLSTEGND